MTSYQKHPSAKIGYPIIVQGLGSNTIGVVSGTAGALTVHSVTATGSRVVALISGGSDGVDYPVEITINISNGEIRIVEFVIQVRDA